VKTVELFEGSRWKGALWGTLLVGSVLIALSVAVNHGVSGAADQGSALKGQGNAEKGKSLFNGKGICYYCHGQDAYLDRLPQLAPDTARFVANLNPKPPDLRDPQKLTLTSDKQRFRIIREGHVGTGMLSDTSLSDEDIHDLLAYLTTLRSPSEAKGDSRR
jgi:cytochrome c553